MKKILILAVAFFGIHAHAGFFAEPFLGLDNQATTAKYVSGVSASASSTGLAYGARLGYSFSGPFWLAGEYMGGSGKDDSASATEYTKTAMSAVVGYDHLKFKFWAGYGFSDELTYKTTPELLILGSNFKVGGGYKVRDNVSMNLEVLFTNYTKAKAGGNEVELKTIYSEFNVTSVMLTASFPFGSRK